MNLSIVILTWNSKRYISTCLDSLIENTPMKYCPYEIYIVDNGSIDGTVEVVKAYQKQYPDYIKPIYLDHNTGTTFSRNLALKKVTGNYIIIMDSDIELSKGSIEKLINVFRYDKSIGMVVPSLIYPSGKSQMSTDRFPTVLSKLKRILFLKRIERRLINNSTTREKFRTVEYAISAFWVLKKDVVLKVGLLDEKIFYAPEDVDYCLRLWMSGYRIIQALGVTIVHDAQEISRGLKTNCFALKHLKGLLYYFSKYRYLFFPPVRLTLQQKNWLGNKKN